MSEFHRHPDGYIFIRTKMGNYADTKENFEIDSGVTLSELPPGADDHIYTQNKRNAIMGDGNIIEGGPMPWPLGDQIISDVATILNAQSQRLAVLKD